VIYLITNFQNLACREKYLKDTKHYSLHFGAKICSEICSRTLSIPRSSQVFSSSYTLQKTICFSEQCVFAPAKASVYISRKVVLSFKC